MLDTLLQVQIELLNYEKERIERLLLSCMLKLKNFLYTNLHNHKGWMNCVIWKNV